jgi:hypothetical protein
MGFEDLTIITPNSQITFQIVMIINIYKQPFMSEYQILDPRLLKFTRKICCIRNIPTIPSIIQIRLFDTCLKFEPNLVWSLERPPANTHPSCNIRALYICTYAPPQDVFHLGLILQICSGAKLNYYPLSRVDPMQAESACSNCVIERESRHAHTGTQSASHSAADESKRTTYKRERCIVVPKCVFASEMKAQREV